MCEPCRSPMPKLQKVDIQCPIKQLVFGTRGTYRAVLMEQKPLTAYEFRDIAEDEDHLPPNKEKDKSDDMLERAFWSRLVVFDVCILVGLVQLLMVFGVSF
eukprot:GHUV01058122.1.p1 GENE.GHUV01058122.1~~GHUV01058122.1.p1  ORF type:complete len:101 (-),score=35.27 GHUV01058122.1:400-702(-)